MSGSRRRQARPLAEHERSIAVRKAARLLAPIALVGAIVVAVVVLGPLGATPAQPSASPATARAVGSIATSEAPSAAPSAGASASSGPAPSASASSVPASPVPIEPVPIVGVASYRSPTTSADAGVVRAALAGRGTWHAVELVASEADAVLRTLKASRSGAGPHLVISPNATRLMADLAAHRDRLGFLRADEVGPGVRALAWGGAQLFGVHHLADLRSWPLTASLPSTLPGVAEYQPSTTWTLWAAGDIGLDRMVAKVVTLEHKGVDYPYAGGTARIARLTCCSPFGWKVPVVVSTGHRGAMRDLISSADIALANMEESAPNHFKYHEHGTVFTGNPALLAGVARAGIDVASCASTHIGDGGRPGILQTVANMKRYGIAAFGCGPNLAAARQPAWFTVDGVKVAILGYDGISYRYYGAGQNTIGDVPLNGTYIRQDVAAARAAGAKVVIVFPHWGTEYTFGPTPQQQRLAHLAINAGADMVIGNHPHWVQSLEVYKGKPIWYALGNFTFDQSWSEQTLEGVTLELTFRGPKLVQAWMDPHVLVDAVQPNLLDPATDGQRVLAPVFQASGRLLPW
jgi:poly-gamma-glutamate synthesis protein (capsule biosynthesis protein)